MTGETADRYSNFSCHEDPSLAMPYGGNSKALSPVIYNCRIRCEQLSGFEREINAITKKLLKVMATMRWSLASVLNDLPDYFTSRKKYNP